MYNFFIVKGIFVCFLAIFIAEGKFYDPTFVLNILISQDKLFGLWSCDFFVAFQQLY